MKRCLLIILFCTTFLSYAQKKIHVFVALCDNENQGIVPVSKTLGNGQNPRTNLYWGALYGVKTHFKRSASWEFVKIIPSTNPKILERVLFKHKMSDTYLFAEAYDGKYIKDTTIDFFKASSGAHPVTIDVDTKKMTFGGDADLVSYIGHDGLMEFQLNETFSPKDSKKRDAIMLACISKSYFKPYLQQTGANPLVWSTGLMSPEAYTLSWALEGWIINETDEQIRERAAKAYHHYQKCGIKGAKRLLVTGY